MMKARYIFLFGALLFLASSCNEEAKQEEIAEGIPMRVEPSLTDDTKASIQTADLQEFCLQLICTDAAFSYFGTITKSGTGWSASQPLYWKDETTPVNFCAAFFSGHTFTAAEFKDSVDLILPADQSTQAGLNSADLLIKPAASIKYEDTAGGDLPVALGHGLAKVNFVLSLGDAFNDAEIGLASNPVTAFTVKGANAGFNFKPQTGTVTVTAATQADITPLACTYTPGTLAAKTATAIYEAILVPQHFAAGELSLTFNIGESKYAWSNAEAITLSAGNTYNLPVSVTFAPPVPTINGHAYVDMGNPSGVKWATCNVGAENSWGYGDYFAWGATAPYYEAGYAQENPQAHWIDGKSSGYYWSSYPFIQSGKIGGKYMTKYTYADGNTNGVWYNFKKVFKGDNGDGVEHKDFASYDYVDDPARQNWGGAWRTPTKQDWDWLLSNCTWVSTSNYNGSGVKGYIVTSKVEGFENNSIFLPFAGSRSSKNLGDLNTYGYYWSASLCDSGNSKGSYRAWTLVSLLGPKMNSNERQFGNSVRPVIEE